MVERATRRRKSRLAAMLTLAPIHHKRRRGIKGWSLTTTKGDPICCVWSRLDKRRLVAAMAWINFRSWWSLPMLRREVRAQLRAAGVNIETFGD